MLTDDKPIYPGWDPAKHVTTWSPADGGPCPKCGCPDEHLEHDVVHVNDDDGELAEVYSVVDCPRCHLRIWTDQC